jgi:hypothetical protein
MGGGSRCTWCWGGNPLSVWTLVTRRRQRNLAKLRPHTRASQHDQPPDTDRDQYHEQSAEDQNSSCEEIIVSTTSGCQKKQRRKKENKQGHGRKKNRGLSRCLVQAQQTDGRDNSQQTENNFNKHDWPQKVAESRVHKHEIKPARRDQDGSDEKNCSDGDDGGRCSQPLNSSRDSGAVIPARCRRAFSCPSQQRLARTRER